MNKEYFSNNRQIQHNWLKNPYQKRVVILLSRPLVFSIPVVFGIVYNKISIVRAEWKKRSPTATNRKSPRQRGLIKVLFVGGGLEDNDKAEDLLFRIIAAMKLNKGEYVLCQTAEKVKSSMGDYLPQVIVSFGAIASNGLLDKKTLLSQVHGKFISKSFTIEEGKIWTCPIVPIFHPEFFNYQSLHEKNRMDGFAASDENNPLILEKNPFSGYNLKGQEWFHASTRIVDNTPFMGI